MKVTEAVPACAFDCNCSQVKGPTPVVSVLKLPSAGW